MATYLNGLLAFTIDQASGALVEMPNTPYGNTGRCASPCIFSQPTSMCRRSHPCSLRECVEIGEGTHFVTMEKNRMQLFQAVQQFLDETIGPTA